MLEALRHRGPDDEGIDEADGATMGARRLSIIDLTGGHQPMANEDGSVIAVQNGEIYNFQTVRDELAARGHAFKTRNDTEVLPHAWEEWGAGLLPRLHGMFAIAIWDARARTLLLARDRFGKKPLMYARVRGSLIFGSEIQALLAHDAVGREVDPRAIDDYLRFGYIPAPRTGFSKIRKLQAGHALFFREGSEPDVQRYWKLSYEPKLKINAEDACVEVRRLIDAAVQRRLISDVPLGAFLSGGLDSSTIVAYMAKHSSRPVQTFSVAFADKYFDESHYARLVARAFGTEHHELVVDAGDVQVLPMLVRHLGEPFADSSIVPTYQIARATRPHVTVALTGDGGDELFAGYGRYRAAAIAEHVPRSTGRLLAMIARSFPSAHGVPRVIPRARRFLMGLGLDAEARHAEWTGYFTGPLRRMIVGERLGAIEPISPDDQLERSAALTGASNASERYMASDILWYLPDDLLVKMDIATMACSLEARAPLLDHELHEFVARLPIEMKLSSVNSKILLRRAMRGILPDAILDRRRKMGFTAPVGAWLRGPLQHLSRDLLLSSTVAADGYVSAEGIRTLFTEHTLGRSDRTMQVWSLLMLELWYREVATRPAAASKRTPVLPSAIPN